jgi:hypothetical protein
VDAAVTLWNLCFRQGQPATAVPHMLRAMRASARRGEGHFIAAHWEDMLRACDGIRVEPALAIRIAEIMERERRDEAARETMAMANARIDDSTPAALQLRLARVAVALETDTSPSIIQRTLAHPELPPDVRSELEAARARIATEDAPEPDDDPSAKVDGGSDEIEVEEVGHSLQVVEAVPRDVDGTSLQLEIGGQVRTMDLQSVQALAVAGVARSGERPLVLVDLLLDSPWSNRPVLRAVRLLSNTFDPRQLMGSEDAVTAMRKLLEHVLEVSEAVPLPDPDAARGRPFAAYQSIAAYQREVLNITA